MARQKAKLRTVTLSNCLSEAVSEIESLRDEIVEWKDNIEEYFSETEKYRALEEAAESLESGFEAMESWETHTTELDKHNKDIAESELQVYQFKYTRRGLARWRRLSNALLCLEAVYDHIGELKQQADEADQLVPSEVGEALGELSEMIENCKDHVEQVEFPSMFG